MLLFLTSAGWAQDIKVSTPGRVATGENFQVVYTLSTADVDEFRLAEVPAGLQLVAGPYRSQQSSIQMVNGHTSSSASTRYTYTFYAEKRGTYTIAGARAVVKGKSLTSPAAKITVAGDAVQSGGTPKMHSDQGAHISSGNELFIRVSADKRSVYEQEPILLTYKVFTTQELTQLEGKMPDLKGFHTQEIPLPQQKSFHMEQVNGKTYKCVTWSQYVMYPQMTGRLEIPSITFKGIVVQENKATDPFEAFLNGGSNYTEIRRNIVAPSISVEVMPLPKRPDGFSGGVGHFTMQAAVSSPKVKAGEALTLTVTVKGTGNIKLLKQPEVKMPTSFDQYEPKITDHTQLTEKGLEGSIDYAFTVIPQTPGEFTIPGARFVYFDTADKEYKTLQTAPVTVTVEKSRGGSSADNETEMKERDIRDIKTGNANGGRLHFWGTPYHWGTILFSTALFALLLSVFRKRAQSNADIVALRNRKANRIAEKRMRKANKLMHEGKDSECCEEVQRILWGYVAYKLNIAPEHLSRENIQGELTKAGIAPEITEQFIHSIDECEYMRYAPSHNTADMQQILDNARRSIVGIEEAIRVRGKNTINTKMLLTILLLCVTTVMQATTKQDADVQYQKGNYKIAADQYEYLLKEEPDAKLYYNLGNAYYRLNNFPLAVLNFERAYRIDPSDGDVLFNLQLSKSKTIDKIQPKSQMLIQRWFLSIIHLMPADAWAILGVSVLVLAFILFFFYLFADPLWLRKVGFYGALLAFLLFLFSHLFAYTQQRIIQSEEAGIVMDATQVYKSASTSSEQIILLHAGTKVIITDKGVKGWYEIELEDGNTGWMETKNLEII